MTNMFYKNAFSVLDKVSTPDSIPLRQLQQNITFKKVSLWLESMTVLATVLVLFLCLYSTFFVQLPLVADPNLSTYRVVTSEDSFQLSLSMESFDQNDLLDYLVNFKEIL